MAHLRTLGVPELRSPEGEVLSRRRKELSLLAYLALRAPKPVSRDELVTLFWDGADGERARHSLRQALSALRRQVGPALEGDVQVRIREGLLEVDAHRFTELAGGGACRAALALWQGDFLDGTEDAGGPDYRLWLEGERERLRAARARCFETLAHEAELRADWPTLVEVCREYCDAYPYLDAPHARLIESLLLSGRDDEARQVHAAYLSRVGDSGDEPPSEAFRALSERVRGSTAPGAADRALLSGPVPWSEAFEAILARWSSVLEGRSQSVWLRGSAGTGKTRLVEELARWLAVRSPEAVVVCVRPDPHSRRASSTALAPLRHAPGLGASSEAALALVAEVVPSLRERYPDLPQAPLEKASDASTVAAALSEVLAGIAGEVPVAVLADDLPSLDPWSARLLAHLAEAPPEGTLVLCTAPPSDGAGTPIWRASPPGADIVRLRDPGTAPSAPSRRRVGVGAAAAVAVLVVAAALVVPLGREGGPAGAARIVAVGPIRLSGLTDSLSGLPELLGANLARIEGIQVLSGGALQALAPPSRLGTSPDDGWREAARRGGATQLIQGTLTRRGDGHLRLDLTRVDVTSGRIIRAYAVEADEAFDLVDTAVERVARDLGVSAATLRPTGGHASLAAYRFFEEGLRAYYRKDDSGARALFATALQEDSTFALATYYLSLVSDTPERWSLLERAARLAQRATERERLLIQAEYATYLGDPARLAKADTLVTLYPMEPTGRLLFGEALVLDGDFLGALRHLRWVVAYDSTSLSGRVPRCLACEALDRMAEAYYLADSAQAAERVARTWLALQPRSPAAWLRYATTLEGLDRYDDALAALDTASVLQPTDPSVHGRRTSILIRRGRLDEAIRLDQARLLTGDRSAREAALWGLAIAYRQAGRFAEALEAARSFRALASSPPAPPEAWIHEAVPEGTVLFDMGRFREAAALFDSIAGTPPTGASEARTGRHRAWALTHAAAAYAALGDTARLRTLEDTVRIEGAKSAFGRDQRLFHHVRGLRFQVEGRWQEAIQAFREALYSPVEGYGRTGLELGRSLTRAGRPAEAIGVLHSALRGPIGASGMYVTRAEIQTALAEAFELAALPDSAALYRDRNRAAWADADAPPDTAPVG